MKRLLLGFFLFCLLTFFNASAKTHPFLLTKQIHLWVTSYR